MSEPTIVDRATWQAERDALSAREKAHTRAGDEIAAARRRLPMVEIDPAATVLGPRGPVPLREVFEGRRQLVAYLHMWHDGAGDAGRCEGCTYYNGQVRELSYLHAHDVTYVTFCRGGWEDSPHGWPQHRDVTPELLRTDGRPTAQWSRLAGVTS